MIRSFNHIYTQVSAAATFSGVAGNMDYVSWLNSAFIIVDINNLFMFDGTNLKVIPSGIQTANVGAGGTGYAVNDIFNITNPSSGINAGTTATGTVTAVSSGVVTGISVTLGGSLYTVASGVTTTATTGSGSGLTINITSLTTLTGNKTIAVWQGRVFVAQGRTFTYSIAGSGSDFSSTGSGYAQISSSDMKQEIVKIVPYMDSIYLVCDHSIWSLTGTTISNDPNNWYTLEVFNSLGALNKFSVINYNNTIYLKNEYGLWLISSTQSEKLDYKLDSTQLDFPNIPSAIAQINNLNFYLLPITGFSPITGTITNIILAYCIDLGQFYFGFSVDGIFTTLSETDHNIYAWDGINIYTLFTGTSNVSVYMQSKYFDFDFDFILKTIRKAGVSAGLRTGTAQLEFQGIAQSIGGSSNKVTEIQQLRAVNYFAWTSSGYPTVPWSWTNQYNTAFYFGSQAESVVLAIFAVNVGGILVSFIISETSNAIYDFVGIFLKGQIGKALM